MYTGRGRKGKNRDARGVETVTIHKTAANARMKEKNVLHTIVLIRFAKRVYIGYIQNHLPPPEKCSKCKFNPYLRITCGGCAHTVTHASNRCRRHCSSTYLPVSSAIATDVSLSSYLFIFFFVLATKKKCLQYCR